jgi:predicted transcriptional regulator
LSAANGNQSQAAKLLGISKQALNKRLKKRNGELKHDDVNRESLVNLD